MTSVARESHVIHRKARPVTAGESADVWWNVWGCALKSVIKSEAFLRMGWFTQPVSLETSTNKANESTAAKQKDVSMAPKPQPQHQQPPHISQSGKRKATEASVHIRYSH